MAPSTAMTPRARKRRRRQPTAPGGVALRCRGGGDAAAAPPRSGKARRASGAACCRAREAAGGPIATGRRERPRAGPARRRSAVPRLRPCKRISSASSRRRLPLLPQSLARSPLPPPTSHLPPPPTCLPPPPPRTPIAPHPPDPPAPAVAAARPAPRRTRRAPEGSGSCAEARPRGGRRRGASQPRPNVHIAGAVAPRSERPGSIDVAEGATRRRGAAEAELGDAAAEAALGDAAREATAQQEDAAESLDAEREASGRAARRGRARARGAAARSAVAALAKPKLGQIRARRRIDDESRASARRQARRAAESRATPRGRCVAINQFLTLPKQPTHTPRERHTEVRSPRRLLAPHEHKAAAAGINKDGGAESAARSSAADPRGASRTAAPGAATEFHRGAGS